jgi:hypothetical protein
MKRSKQGESGAANVLARFQNLLKAIRQTNESSIG